MVMAEWRRKRRVQTEMARGEPVSPRYFRYDPRHSEYSKTLKERGITEQAEVDPETEQVREASEAQGFVSIDPRVVSKKEAVENIAENIKLKRALPETMRFVDLNQRVTITKKEVKQDDITPNIRNDSSVSDSVPSIQKPVNLSKVPLVSQTEKSVDLTLALKKAEGESLVIVGEGDRFKFPYINKSPRQLIGYVDITSADFVYSLKETLKTPMTWVVSGAFAKGGEALGAVKVLKPVVKVIEKALFAGFVGYEGLQVVSGQKSIGTAGGELAAYGGIGRAFSEGSAGANKFLGSKFKELRWEMMEIQFDMLEARQMNRKVPFKVLEGVEGEAVSQRTLTGQAIPQDRLKFLTQREGFYGLEANTLKTYNNELMPSGQIKLVPDRLVAYDSLGKEYPARVSNQEVYVLDAKLKKYVEFNPDKYYLKTVSSTPMKKVEVEMFDTSAQNKLVKDEIPFKNKKSNKPIYAPKEENIFDIKEPSGTNLKLETENLPEIRFPKKYMTAEYKLAGEEKLFDTMQRQKGRGGDVVMGGFGDETFNTAGKTLTGKGFKDMPEIKWGVNTNMVSGFKFGTGSDLGIKTGSKLETGMGFKFGTVSGLSTNIGTGVGSDMGIDLDVRNKIRPMLIPDIKMDVKQIQILKQEEISITYPSPFDFDFDFPKPPEPIKPEEPPPDDIIEPSIDFWFPKMKLKGMKGFSMKKPSKRVFAYQPSITGIAFKIKQPKTPKNKVFTGLEVRGI